MFDRAVKRFSLQIPPWPSFLSGNYRYFENDEKHVTRICSDFVMIFMLQNSLFFTEDGKDVEVKKGEWYIQVPGLKQEGRRGSPAPGYYYIHFQGNGEPYDESDVVNEGKVFLTESFRNPVLNIRGNFDIQHMKHLFEQLEWMFKRRHFDMLGCQTVFLSILRTLVLDEFNNIYGSQNLMISVVNYLTDHFDKPITSRDLSDKFHFTYDYITRVMKRSYGITPWQFVQRLRMERAKELLENTDYTLSNIAAQVGYNDLSVFYKAFKKYTDIAPGVWRIKARGQNIK